MLPFGNIGGDYRCIYQAGEHRIVFGLCDDVGRTLASALVAARVNTFVSTPAADVKHPCERIEPLNSFLCRNACDSPC